MAKFYNKDLADLAHQLTLSPRRLRVAQIRAVEGLLGTVEPERAYPYEFICYRITDYRRRGSGTGASIPGKALINDLVMMAELLSRKAKLALSELGEAVSSHESLAEELSVSTKTVRRWRSRGLMGLRAVCEDGVNRLVFLRSTIDRFKAQHKGLVARGAAFRQLTNKERERIVERARELIARRPMKLHAAARRIAEETGRATETIRYTLRRYDASCKTKPLFSNDAAPCFDERALTMWTCRERGDSSVSIARAMRCSVDEVEHNLRSVDIQRWKHEPYEFVTNELFDAPNADAMILKKSEPQACEPPAVKIPKDLPPYLQALYRTPLLTREQEADLFRRYNYLKYKAAKRIDHADPEGVSKEAFDEIVSLRRRIEQVRQRIIRANLRLVVSIAKRHVRHTANLFEVVSDGNMSLMRAAEKFDFARGNKFSTYASWAIMKNYARSIPEQYCRASRWVTGQELVLESITDDSARPASPSDRAHVQKAIETGLNELTEREREVVRGHFGLNDSEKPATLEQLGQRLGVTKERVRQIEQKALARLRELLSPALADVL